ncbi:MAG: cobalamin-independent methionine synthase II family protein [Alphaproteobacteria bacterium]|jgi:5-methyltetrahydropteroyltriglutamate--homocysteine methyltransferase|nr:cobalamin-independent methionine synthase II family protein [Alphaproteobacteria bacterium]MDP6814704.1 cobalamin-independent methionine synthase II family protein [Alphaproteobacteria bacterium]
MPDLPILLTMGVGSSALPGWMHLFRRHMRDAAAPMDVEEAFDDATRLAIADQVDAGIDIVSDGELHRQRFVYEMYERISGIERQQRPRKLGVPGYDMAPKFVANDKVGAPGGLGLVAEYETLRRLAPDCRLKIAFPGPLTFANNILPGAHYGDGEDAAGRLMDDVVVMLRDEVEALRLAGAEFIQIDEPGLTFLPKTMTQAEGANCINQVTRGLTEFTAVHVCFGNNASRPSAPRGLKRLMDAMEALDTRMLVLEFANREMSELDILAPLSERFDVAAGVIDVKSFHQESPEDVADRIRQVLRHVPAERLTVTADCGFSAIPRWLACQKMGAMVAGARLVRDEL